MLRSKRKCTCSCGSYSVLGLDGTCATAMLRCALCYAPRKILHTHLLPGLLGCSLH